MHELRAGIAWGAMGCPSMPMTEAELSELIERGHELPGVEFKPPGTRDDKRFFAKVVRAILGMANRRDGGMVVIGVAETPTKKLLKTGVSRDQAATWAYDHIVSGLAPYAEPSVVLDVSQVTLEGKVFVVLRIEEFEEVPVLCRKSYQRGNELVLREGACYVRSRKKIETVEVSTFEDMRELIDLATVKSVRRFAARASAAGLLTAREELESPSEQYDDERRDFR